MARLTALRKPDGGVRGIATGDAFRRLVARTLAKQWAPTIDQATRPFQFAMQSRAGTDALVLSVRAAPGHAGERCDRLLRWSREVAPQLLPFARLFYGQASAYCWWDAAGNLREIPQSEGCEQGDPLAPALFALGQHESLARAAETLHPSDCLMAFLDDLYLVTVPDRCRGSLDAVTHSVAEGCGIASNLGKTRAIGAIAGAAPPGVAELGPDMWRGDKPPNQRGMVVFGSPVGHPDFIAAWTAQRRSCWSICRSCRTYSARGPPPDISLYAQAHDAAMWATLLELLGGGSDTTEAALLARAVASLPAALGGLGLQSASRLAPATYWAAWADSLPVIQARFPDMAAQLHRHLGDDNARCLAHADAARRLLITEGWGDCPNWHDITGGLLAAPHAEAGLGDWPHGSTIATTCCCQPCRPTTGPCFAPNPGRTQTPGLPLSLEKQPPRSRRKPCKLRFGDDCACPSQLPPGAVARHPAAEGQSTCSATTR